MTAFATADLGTLLHSLQAAAVDLDDESVGTLVRGLVEHSRAPRPQILVAGTTGSGRASLVNVVTGVSDLLPRSALPKLPLPVVVRHGAAEHVELHAENGLSVSLPSRVLRSAWLGQLSDAPRPQWVEVFGDASVLALCDFRIEALEAFHSDEEWQDILTRTDFVFLVLNALSPLSQRERAFVRDYLAQSFGLQRVAIVLNGIDRVSEDERAAVVDHVRLFLGSFAAQPAVFALSADALLTELISEEAPSASMDALQQTLRDITDHAAAVRERTIITGARAAVHELELGVARNEAILSLDASRIDELRATLHEREQELQVRAERVQGRVRTFVGTLVQEQLLREISTFGDMVRRRLPEDIRAVGNVGIARKHLPGYMEKIWSDFLNRQVVATHGKLADEAMTVGRAIDTDLREVLGDDLVDFRAVLGDFDPTEEVLRTVVMPKRSKHYAAGLAKGLSLHGYIMFIFNPPIGILSLAMSHVVERVYRTQITGSQMDELIGSAVAAERDLEDEITRRVHDQFRELVEDLRTEILFVYRRAVGSLQTALDAEAASEGSTAARMLALERLRTVTIPEIRGAVEALSGGVFS